MRSPLLNRPAPDFTCEAHDRQPVRLADYRGRQVVVLYFYPRDETPLCTREACGFRDAYEEFTRLSAVVLGVSGDSPQRHRAFAAGRRLPFPLLSDADGSLRAAYRVPKLLGLFPGRTTYVIDRQGVVRHVFNAALAAQRHVDEALQVVRQLLAEGGERSGEDPPPSA